MTVSELNSHTSIPQRVAKEHSASTQNLWHNEIFKDSHNVPTDLKRVLEKVSNLLIYFPYTIEARKQYFIDAMKDVEKMYYPFVLFYLVSCVETRKPLLDLIVKADLCIETDILLKGLLVDGVADNVKIGKYNKYGLQVTKEEIIGSCTSFIADLIGRVAEEWIIGGKSGTESCIEMYQRFKLLFKMMTDCNTGPRVSVHTIADHLVLHYRDSLKKLFCIPRDMETSFKNYYPGCLPFLSFCLNSRDGVRLIHEVIQVYVNSDEYDHQAFINMIFLERNPCDFQSYDPFNKIFGKKFSLSPVCRQLVLKTTRCIVPLISRIHENGPEISFRCEWQRSINKVLEYSSIAATMSIPRIKNAYAWAMHFAEVPSDLFEVLQHEIDFNELIARYFNSELSEHDVLFEAMFDLSIRSVDLLKMFRERFPERTRELIQGKMKELCVGYLRAPVTCQEMSIMNFFNPLICISYHLQQEKRSLGNILNLIRQSVLEGEVSVFNEIFDALNKSLERYRRQEQISIILGLVESLQTSSPRVISILIDKLDQNLLNSVVSRLWENGELNKEFFDEVFPVKARNPAHPGYIKFITALNAHMDKDAMYRKLVFRINVPTAILVVGNSGQCGIQ